MNRFNPFARAGIVLSAYLALALGVLSAARAQTPTLPLETRVITTWYKLSLELVRHTPTYSPPVAARTYGYLGVGVYEIIAARSSTLRSLAGQLNGFKGVPQPTPGAQYDTASSLEYALSGLVRALFANTGPSGQR